MHVSNFQCVWRYNCLNVTHKKPYKGMKEKKNEVLIPFTGYANDLNQWQQFKVSFKKSHHRLQWNFQPS